MSKDFDPASVPVYPVVRMSLVGDQVLVDDVPVVVPPGVEPRVAGLSVVAARAAAREGAVQAIRAVASDGAGNSWPVVVDADGGVWPLDKVGSTPTSPGRRTGRGSTRSRVGVRLGVGAAAVVVAVTAVGGVVLLGHSSAPASGPVSTVTVTPSATATELPVIAPVGWSAQAVWSSVPVPSPAGAPTAAPVVVSGATVFTVIAHGVGGVAVAALNARTGAVQWSRPVTGSQVSAGPVLGRVNGSSVVMVATDTRVVAFSPAGVAVGSWPVPTNGGAATGGVVLSAAGPILPRSQTTVSIVGPGNKLLTRALPPGGRAVAVLGRGAVLVTDTAGHAYRVTSPTVAGKPVTLPAPKGFTGGSTVAVTGGQLVQSWTSAKAGAGGAQMQVLRASALSTLRPSWTTAAIPASSAATPVMVSPDGRTGVAGSVVVNLATGASSALPAGWSPLGVGSGVIWCRNADQKVVAASPAGAVIGGAGTGTSPSQGTVGGGSGQPVSPYALVGGSALVLASADSVPRLYLLPALASPAGAASPPAPVSTTPPVPTALPSTPAKKPVKKSPTKKAPAKKPSPTSSAGGHK